MPGLVISPSEDDHSYLRNVFESLRRRLYSARSCGDGLRLLEVRGIDLVICDRELPGGTWEDVLAAAARLAVAPPVIVAAHHPDERFWLEVLERGGCDVLAKPFRAREVVPALSLAGQCWRSRKQAVGPRGERGPRLVRPAARAALATRA